MLLDIRDTAPTGRNRIHIAFLHESRNPAEAAPQSVRAQVAEACRVSRFRGREKEVSGALTPRGGWVLVGLGPPGSPIGKLRKALRRAVKGALRQPGLGLVLAFGEGVGKVRMRAFLREIAQGDYR